MFQDLVELIKQLNKASRRSKNATEALNQEMQKQYCLMRIRQMMIEMTRELFTCFEGKNYPFIAKITQPSDMRLHNYYQEKNGKIVYVYRLQKQDNRLLTQNELCKLREMMNDDIAYKKIELQGNFGVGLLFQFPYLVQGMQVVGVGYNNSLEILIYISN